MVGESIPNFDSYAWVAVGLFVVGLFMVMLYERSSSRSKSKEDQQRSAGTNPNPPTDRKSQ